MKLIKSNNNLSHILEGAHEEAKVAASAHPVLSTAGTGAQHLRLTTGGTVPYACDSKEQKWFAPVHAQELMSTRMRRTGCNTSSFVGESLHIPWHA